MRDALERTFFPDWTLHPGVHLAELMRDNSITPGMLVAVDRYLDRDLVDRLLAYDPAAEVTVFVARRIRAATNRLTRGRCPPAGFWRNLWLLYQADLERGAKDVSADNGKGIQPMTTGAELIAEERRRQLEKGYDEHHDRGHSHGELVRAGIAFAWSYLEHPAKAEQMWPFAEPLGALDEERHVPLRDLVRAGAMIAAELDRLGVDHVLLDVEAGGGDS